MRVLIKRVVAMIVCFCMVFVNMNYSSGVENDSAVKLNDLGLLLGISEDELSSDLSREIGLTMILKALGYTETEAKSYESKSPFSDTQGWSKGWASLAYDLAITKGTSETTFSPTKLLSEKEFLTFLLRALGYDANEAYMNTLEIAKEAGLVSQSHNMNVGKYTKSEATDAMFNSLSARELSQNVALARILIDKGLFTVSDAIEVGVNNISANALQVFAKSYSEVKVVFEEPVQTTSYTFDISGDSLNYRAIAKWNTDKTIASILMVSPLTPGKYVMKTSELTGDRTKYVNDFRIYEHKEYLDVSSEAIAYINGATINYSFRDMYQVEKFEEFDSVPIISAENLTKDMLHEVQLLDSSTSHRLRLPNLISEGGKIGDIIRISMEINGVKASKDLEVVLKSDFSLFDLYNPIPQLDSSRFNMNQKNIIIPYSFYDDKGTALKLNMHSANYDESNNVEIIDSLIFTSSNPSIIDVDSIRVNIDGIMKIDLGSAPGTAELRVYNTKDQSTKEMQIVVYPDSELQSVEVTPQTKLYSVGEEIELKTLGFDQFGASISLGYISGLIYSSSDESVVDSSSVKLLNGVFRCQGLEEGIATITIRTKTGLNLGNVEIQIVGEPEPMNIVEVNIPKYIEASPNATIEIGYSDLVVVDQFAREYDLSINDERIFIEEVDNDEVNLELGTGSFIGGGLEISGIEDEVGAFEYKVYIEDLDYSAQVFTMTSVDSEDITKYELTSLGELKLDTNPSADIELKGYLENGQEVVLASDKSLIVTSSDLSIVTTTVEENVISFLAKDAGVTTISVWLDSEIIATVDLTVLDADE